MKQFICLAGGFLAFTLTSAFGQPMPTAAPVPHQPPNASFQHFIAQSSQMPDQPPALTKFNLDFPGGTPIELVAAIEKATGKPLNAIIPKDDEGLRMPPLKMNDVVVPQLFAALEAASRTTVAFSTGQFGGAYSQFNGSYGFKTTDSPLTDASIWYFRAEKPSLPPVISTQKVSQFYPLAEYLERGFSVDDITTAIQTGWKMAGETSPPELSYHKETKLLIAFGEPQKLDTIKQVLNVLPAQNALQTRGNYQYLHGLIEDLEKQVAGLESQIAAMKKQLPSPISGSGNSSEEKSGK